MKSVGEAMSIGRTFREALGKAIRSLETGRAGFDAPLGAMNDDLPGLERAMAVPGPERLFQLARGFQLGLGLDRAHELTRIDPWFLRQIHAMAMDELAVAAAGGLAAIDAATLRRYKRGGCRTGASRPWPAPPRARSAPRARPRASSRSTSGSTPAPPSSRRTRRTSTRPTRTSARRTRPTRAR
jgi:hypothetical protein